MALPVDASSWAEEIQAADDFAAKHRKRLMQLVQHYQSNWYRDDVAVPATPENIIFSWVQWMLPQLAYSAPSPAVQAEWAKIHEDLARYMQTALGKWARKTDLGTEMCLWVRDALLGWGVMKIGLEGTDLEDGTERAYGRGGVKPFAVRVSPWDWGCDGKGKSMKDSRFEYHKYYKDLDSVASIPGIDASVLPTLVSTFNPAANSGDGPVPNGRTADRKRVTLIDVWVKETRQIGTLICDGESAKFAKALWLRPLRAWNGPDSGPFVYLSYATVPDEPYGLSYIQPVMEQLETMWAHQKASVVEAMGKKSFVGVDADATDDETRKQLQNVPPNGIAYIKGLKLGAVQQLTVGGEAKGRIDYINVMRDGVQRMLGYTEAQQSLANTQTATANSIADKNSDIRTEWLRTQTLIAATRVFEAAGWYLFYDANYVDRITINQTVTDPMTGQVQQQPQSGYFMGGTEGQWIGGQYYPPMTDVEWPGDFEVSVEPNSMSHTSNVQKQQDAMMLFDVAERTYQGMAMAPGVNWRDLVDRVGEALNIRNLFDTLISPAAVQMAGQQAQMFSAGPPPVPQGASPSLARGIGRPSATPSAGPAFPPRASALGGMNSPQAGRGFPPKRGASGQPTPSPAQSPAW